MRDVAIPAVGFAMTEAVLQRWLKHPGESVDEGEPVAEIETDKTTAELESPASGTLGRHRFGEGELVPVGVVLTVILAPGEIETDDDQTTTVPAAATAAQLTTAGAAAGPLTSAGALAAPVTTAATGPALAVATNTSPTTVAGPAVDAARQPRRESPRQRAMKRDIPAAPPPSEFAPVDLDGIATAVALAWLESMLRIREFESRCDPLVLTGRIAGGVHLSLGQEAVAAGAASALRPGDLVAGTHRSHHHALAMGIPATTLMAELFGRASGSNGGRGGSMHVADVSRGFIGGNGIVGAGVGIALGAALSANVRESGQVAVGYVGDGGVNTGRTWETVNLAAVWRLPLIVICENNLYAVETPSVNVTASPAIVDRAAGFGINAESVDGQDVGAVHRAVTRAADRARAGEGATFIEARTYRYEGHSTGQAITYRTTEEVASWRTNRDPISRLRVSLSDHGAIDDAAFEALTDTVRAEIDAAVAFAEAASWPIPADATRGVTEDGASIRRLA